MCDAVLLVPEIDPKEVWQPERKTAIRINPPAVPSRSPRGSTKPRRSDREEDEDEEEEAGSGSTWLLVTLILLVLLAGGGVTMWILFSGDDSKVAQQNEDPQPKDVAQKNEDKQQFNADDKKVPIEDPNKKPPVDDPNKKPVENPPKEDPSSVVVKLTPEQIYQRVLQSTAWVVFADPMRVGWGSGSLIHQERKLILTNFHVTMDAGPATKFTVFFPDYKGADLITEAPHYVSPANMQKLGIPARVVYQDKSRDLALLELATLPPNVKALPLAAKSASTAQRVHSIGASGVDIKTRTGALWKYVTGTVSNLYKNDITFNAKTKREFTLSAWILETQSATNPGDSGGPMVNDSAQLVAVVQGGNVSKQNLDYNVDIREVRHVLNEAFRDVFKSKWEDVNDPGLPAGKMDTVALLKALDSKNSTVVIRALKELQEVGGDPTPALQPLVKLLKSDDAAVRFLVKDALKKVGTPSKEDVSFLAEALRDKASDVRLAAAEFLSKLGADAQNAASALGEALEDSEKLVSIQAAQTLGKIGSSARNVPIKDKGTVFKALADALKSDSSKLREAAGAALLQMGRPEVSEMPALKVMLWAKGSAPEVRCYAVQALADIPGQGKEVLPELLKALEDSEKAVRRGALSGLCQVGLKENVVVTAVAKALQDSDKEVRQQAVTTLTAIGLEKPEVVVPALAKALSDSDKGVRVLAAKALVPFGAKAKDAVPTLVKMLSETESRLDVIRLLGKMGEGAEPAAKDLAVLMRTSGEDKDLRAELKRTLGEMGKGAEPAVSVLLGYFNVVVKDKKELPLFDEIIDTIGKIGEPARKSLYKAVRDDKNFLVRLAGVMALEKTQPTGAEATKVINFLKARMTGTKGGEKHALVWNEMNQVIQRLRLVAK
jgi:HEAT repeat protein/S1-C subfamily serine protease